MLLRELATVNRELTAKQQELRQCIQQNQPALPDLVAQTVILHVHHDTRQLGVAALVKNIGVGSATGPFEIDLAVTLIRGDVTTSFVQVFQVPANVTIFGVPIFTTELQQSPHSASSQALPPGGPIVTPSSEYLTQAMQVPLYYRDEDPPLCTRWSSSWMPSRSLLRRMRETTTSLHHGGQPHLEHLK